MPGITDRRSLTNAILDSVIISDSSLHRLSSRNVSDIAPAVRLRKYEIDLLSRLAPKSHDLLLRVCKDSLINSRSGNQYVYAAMQFMYKITSTNDMCLRLRDKSVLKAFEMLPAMMISKLPKEQNIYATHHLPEGYGRAQGRYIALRTIHTRLLNMFSKTGAHRGYLQSLSTKNKSDYLFTQAAEDWEGRFNEKMRSPENPAPSVYIKDFCEGLKVTMIRISDVILLSLDSYGTELNVLMTQNHFERLTSFLVQFSNIDLGLVLGYGMDSPSLGEEVACAAGIMIRQMCSMGVKDDLAPGEAGKAVTDLYKAKLSQTDELPWDNYRMLLSTYSDVRKDNALSLYDYFRDYRFDPDVMLNLSYAWKCCLQPDSDIRKDFIELTEGLSKPNPIKEGSAKALELAFRRALLVGALKEGRQPEPIPTEGHDLDPEVRRVCSLSQVKDSDLRRITYGMMENLTVRVPHVFPDVYDTSHLSFKDKASSIESLRVRREVSYRSSAQSEYLSAEDSIIMEHAEMKATDFFKSFHPVISKEPIENALKTTANDIISSLDEKLGRVFREADSKYQAIVRSLSGLAAEYGDANYVESLLQWSKDHPELLINTATEPKLGEVHKRTVRIFYMFEKGMKTFLSQFERMSRIMDYYIKGAEIVKGDRSREKHMNILSSAHRAVSEGVLAYQILFDLSKFSQKFNHRLIDAAAKVIGEAADYPEYQHISVLFKAAFLYVSARNVDESFTGVLGAFEGFLNFLWTGIHATVMDIALKSCGRSGDLAAYSDDGLLMFTMESNLDSPREELQNELKLVIDSITSTYKDYGLDFNLGKTLISRTLAEFLGVIQYQGKRMPTWVKELSSLGQDEEVKMIKSLSQEITDISSQMSAMIKAGMPPYAATYVGYLEILLGPGRRVYAAAKSGMSKLSIGRNKEVAETATCAFLSLNGAFGGTRVPDPLTIMSSADFDPISEMLQDLHQMSEMYPLCQNLGSYLIDSVSPTDDYTKLFLGSSPINTEGVSYGTSIVRDGILKRLKNKFPYSGDHPLSKRRAPDLHYLLEETTDIYLPTLVSLCRYIISVIEYDKMIAPSKSSSIARLLKKAQVASIQSMDTKSFQRSVEKIVKALINPGLDQLPSADHLYRKSFPKLRFAPAVPSYREISKLSVYNDGCCYRFRLSPHGLTDNKGSKRLLNRSYYDELVPPLITSDISMQHLTNAPDLAAHCLRGLYSEIVSAASQGHDVLALASVICDMNNIPMIPMNLIANLHDMRKLAIANRKKTVHRVHWSMATRSAGTLIREGELNNLMTQSTNLHYSLIVTVAIAQAHFRLTLTNCNRPLNDLYISIDPGAAKRTGAQIMRTDYDLLPYEVRLTMEDSRRGGFDVRHSTAQAIRHEASRAIDNARLEIQDCLITGRMGMFSDLKPVSTENKLSDPLKYAVVWTLVSRLNNAIAESIGSAGVISSKTESYSVESISPDLSNMAIIYRAYTQVRKGELSKYIKSGNKKPILDKAIALDTLYAASCLHLVHTMSVESLMDRSSAETYASILAASENSMVYYSLEPSAETFETTTVSSARATAIGRVIESLVSQLFKEDVSTPERDMTKLIMMIVRGCVRGSVHRTEAYNKRVVVKWIMHYSDLIKKFVETLPERYAQALPNSDYCKKLSKELLVDLRALIDEDDRAADDIDLGDASQFEPAKKFIINLGKWGALPVLPLPPDHNDAYIEVTRLERYMINPALKFVRTISYSTINEILKVSPIKGLDIPSSSDHLTGKISNIIANTPEIDLDDLVKYINVPGSMIYRETYGSLKDFEFYLEAPGIDDNIIPALYCYSLAMPLMLSIGRSSLGSIVDYAHRTFSTEMTALENFVHEYSLPFQDSSYKTNLYIFRSMSERQLVASLETWCRNSDGPAMLIIEIPPVATITSLAVIKWLTSANYSYACPGISSDYGGYSLYITSFMEPSFPENMAVPVSENFCFEDLGDAALGNLSKVIEEGRQDIPCSLMLTPLHQAGLPVGGRIKYMGREIDMRVTEELVDTTRVSFIEATRPSKILTSMAASNPRRIMHILRALKYKTSIHPAPVSAILASSHYYHALVPRFTPDEYAAIFVELVNSNREVKDKKNCILHFYDPLMAMQEIPLSELPPDVQIGEAQLPAVKLPRFQASKKLVTELAPLLRVSGYSTLPVETQGDVLRYFMQLEGEPDMDHLRAMTCKIEDDDDEEYIFEGEYSLPSSAKPPEDYGSRSVVTTPVPLQIHSSESEQIVEDLRSTMTRAFALDTGQAEGEPPPGNEEPTNLEIIFSKLSSIHCPMSDIVFLNDTEEYILEDLAKMDPFSLFNRVYCLREEVMRNIRDEGGVI